MKKIMAIGFLIILLISPLLSQQDAWDTETDKFSSNRTNIGFKTGMGLFSKDNYETGLNFGINFNLFLSSKLSIELSVQRSSSEVKQADQDIFKGTLILYPIQFSLKYQFSTTSKFVPYLLAGIDYLLFDHQIDITEWENINFSGSSKIKGSIGYHGGFGFDLFISNSLALNLDLRYIISTTECDWEFHDILSPNISISNTLNDLKINFLNASAGFKFYF